MTMEMGSEHVYYLPCNFCNTILAEMQVTGAAQTLFPSETKAARKQGLKSHGSVFFSAINHRESLGRTPSAIKATENKIPITDVLLALASYGGRKSRETFQLAGRIWHGGVSVPCTNLLNIVTIRCGHCSNLQSVNMGALLPAAMSFQGLQAHTAFSPQSYGKECGSSSSRFNKISMMNPEEEPRVLPNRPPEKRQRVPSAYNRFIKEEIQRIKACNPDISHKEAFSTAAKNWAHFPHIQFGLSLEGNKQAKFDDTFLGGGTAVRQAFQ